MQGCWRHAEVTSTRRYLLGWYFFNGYASQSFPFNKQMEATFHLFSFYFSLCTGFCIVNWENIVMYNWVSIPFPGRFGFLFSSGTEAFLSTPYSCLVALKLRRGCTHAWKEIHKHEQIRNTQIWGKSNLNYPYSAAGFFAPLTIFLLLITTSKVSQELL